ncbi:MAG: Bifunctional NAD(P)H-hydrate repair enzyme Nnr [Smithella sp. PtaU1.Bin162]|nr:MAG: Bifunctional NAD(P)H-hydrate repair enzyme Nnr [Smithella sp. PtaU1.Bin162]
MQRLYFVKITTDPHLMGTTVIFTGFDEERYMKLATVEEMRFLDRSAMEKLGISEEILMENAALASIRVLQREIGISGKKFVVFCGSGNNGGDGLAVARLIHSNGGMVKIFLTGDRKKYRGAAKTNLDIISRLPVLVIDLRATADARKDVMHCDAVIDAIFGTGLDREVKGLAADVIGLVNACRHKVISLDIPSGVNGNTGEIMGAAVKADYTVTFGLPKIGNILYPGHELCGKLFVTHISFPPSFYASDDLKVEINGYVALPPRPAEAYKGSMGDVLFIAGAANYYGAPYFAAMSFMKSGGGYARLAAPQSIISTMAKKGREIVYLPQEETAAGSIALKNKQQLLTAANGVDLVVIGPGLSLQEETARLVKELISKIKIPLLIDGDGLTALASDPSILQKRKAQTILTPHLGEMARLTGKSAAEISKNKITILQETAKKLKAAIVLKGAHSLIGLPDGRVYVNLSGNAGMATAGSGDVLTGCIAAMCGMGLTPGEATRKGVFLHGYAGDLAAHKKGADGITARDIMEFLPQAMKNDRAGNIEAEYFAPPVI